jgi:AMIN domain-containing protein
MKWLIQTVLLVLLLLSGQEQAAAADAATIKPVLREIVKVREGEATVFEIRADRPLTYNFYLMPELWKGIIDLPNVDPGQVEPVRPITAGLIKRVAVRRKEVNEVPVTRVVFDLSREVEMAVVADPLDKGKLVATFRPGKFSLPATPTAAAGVPAAPSGLAAGNRSGPAKTALQPVVASAPAATTVTAVRLNSDSLEIVADGRLDGFRGFALKQPNRLVVDLDNVRSAVRTVPVPANRHGIRAIRLGPFNGKLRIVFDLAGQPVPPHRINKTATGLLISLAPASPTAKH